MLGVTFENLIWTCVKGITGIVMPVTAVRHYHQFLKARAKNPCSLTPLCIGSGLQAKA